MQSLDGSIRIWDVPTGSCIDWLSFQSPPTSLTLSSTGEFLVTAHDDSVGLSVWCDKSFFHQVVLDGTPPLKPAKMELPCPMAEVSAVIGEEIRSRTTDALSSQQVVVPLSANGSKGEETAKEIKVTPKADGLVTLSGLPPGHWKNLFHLELIKERNRPKEAPKKPPSAPFFLQWRQGEKINNPEDTEKETALSGGTKDAGEEDAWNAVWSDDDLDEASAKGKERVVELKQEEGLEHPEPSRKRKKSYLRSKLADVLQSCFERKTGYAPATAYFSELGPSAIDIELTELCHGEQDQEGMELLLLASNWLLEACQSKKSFEAVNAYLNRFLYLHANTIAGIEIPASTTNDEEEQDQLTNRKSLRKDVLSSIESLRTAQREAAELMRGKMQHAICLLQNFSLLV